MYAACAGRRTDLVPLAENLGRSGIAAQTSAKNAGGVSALMLAAYCGQASCVEVLLGVCTGNEVNAVSHPGVCSPLIFAAAGRPDALVSPTAQALCTTLLLGAGADAGHEDATGCSALHYAAAFGRLAVVGALVGFCLRAQEGGRILRDQLPHALGAAAAMGHVAVVEFILRTLGATDNPATAPTSNALSENYPVMPSDLLRIALDAQTPAVCGNPVTNMTGESGNEDEVLSSVATSGGIGGGGCHDALMHAALGGHTPVIELLIRAGSSVNPRARLTETKLPARKGVRASALALAAQGGHLEALLCLLSHGAMVNAIDNLGRTPIMGAAKNGHLEVVEALIAAGASVETTDWDCQTAEGFARTYGHHVVASLLRTAYEARAAERAKFEAEEAQWNSLPAVHVGDPVCVAVTGVVATVRDLLAAVRDHSALDDVGQDGANVGSSAAFPHLTASLSPLHGGMAVPCKLLRLRADHSAVVELPKPQPFSGGLSPPGCQRPSPPPRATLRARLLNDAAGVVWKSAVVEDVLKASGDSAGTLCARYRVRLVPSEVNSDAKAPTAVTPTHAIVHRSLLKPRAVEVERYAEGDKVEVLLFTAGEVWVRGVVVGANEDGTYDIQHYAGKKPPKKSKASLKGEIAAGVRTDRLRRLPKMSKRKGGKRGKSKGKSKRK